MTSWRQEAECVWQGADPEMFVPKDHHNGMIPKYARQAVAMYCDHCFVRAECGAFADRTQTAGVFGGKYREIGSGKYRVYDPATGEKHEEEFTSYFTVRGDRVSQYDRPDPTLIPTTEVMARLGHNSPQATTRFLKSRGIYPVCQSGGNHQNLYDPDEIDAVVRAQVAS